MEKITKAFKIFPDLLSIFSNPVFYNNIYYDVYDGCFLKSSNKLNSQMATHCYILKSQLGDFALSLDM